MKFGMNSKRRKVLLAAALGLAGTIAAVAANLHVVIAPADAKAISASDSKGHRASEHMRHPQRSTRT